MVILDALFPKRNRGTKPPAVPEDESLAKIDQMRKDVDKARAFDEAPLWRGFSPKELDTLIDAARDNETVWDYIEDHGMELSKIGVGRSRFKSIDTRQLRALVHGLKKVEMEISSSCSPSSDYDEREMRGLYTIRQRITKELEEVGFATCIFQEKIALIRITE